MASTSDAHDQQGGGVLTMAEAAINWAGLGAPSLGWVGVMRIVVVRKVYMCMV